MLEKEEGLESPPMGAPSMLCCTASPGLNTKVGNKICASSPFQEGNGDTEAQMMSPQACPAAESAHLFRGL